MSSVAIIGPDGAGKTTISRMLEASSSLPFKYLYMGINIGASNFALPSSRLIEYWKQYRDKKSSVSQPESAFLHDQNDLKCRPDGKLWAAGRLANRLAEEWYRQLLSWSYQTRGYVVLYDRHFLFDFSNNGVDGQSQPLFKRIHTWCLTHFYPRPDLVIYLDAPAELLLARKGEWTLQYLESRRQAFIRQGKQMLNFIVIDASQPVGMVYSEVTEKIMRFYESRHG